MNLMCTLNDKSSIPLFSDYFLNQTYLHWQTAIFPLNDHNIYMTDSAFYVAQIQTSHTL